MKNKRIKKQALPIIFDSIVKKKRKKKKKKDFSLTPGCWFGHIVRQVRE